MSWIILVLILCLALFLIVLEIVAIPGFTICGIGGLLLLCYGIASAFYTYGPTVGFITLFASLGAGALLFAYFLRSKTWERFKLKETVSGKVNEIDSFNLQAGEKGITISRLAPMGLAEFRGHSVEVYSLDALIDPGSNVEILFIDGNKIAVKQI